MTTTTLHISLPEELECQDQEHLDALLLEGLDSGEAQPLDEAEWASDQQEVEEGIAAQRRSADPPTAAGAPVIVDMDIEIIRALHAARDIQAVLSGKGRGPTSPTG